MSVRPAALLSALGTTVVGQHETLEALTLAAIADGHVLLEGPPGLAKTLACRALAAALDGAFKRIQFTPDLLPSDVVGTRIFDQHESAFATVFGPIFANVVLADEINRAPAKVQSALLEAMQERQVTIGLETHALPDPFVVLATMNPLDADGTYALPFAQMDRFLMKVVLDYPTRSEEREILERYGAQEAEPVRGIASLADLRTWREQSAAIHADDRLKDYVVDLVAATRKPPSEVAPYVERGASPRATLAVLRLARAKALLEDRTFVLPDDVRSVAMHALRHRVAFSYRVQAEGVDADALVQACIAAVPAP